MPADAAKGGLGSQSASLATLRGLYERQAKRALAVGWTDPAACSAIRTRFKPTDMVWAGSRPTPAPRGVAHIETPDALPPADRFDLIVAGPGVGRGGLGEVQRRLQALAGRLTAQGTALLALDCYAARGDGRLPLDAALFPALAAGGALGEEARDRAPLGPANWLLMLAALGLTPQSLAGYGDTPPSEAERAQHGPRLALYDDHELATSRLLVLATPARRKP